MLHATGRGMLQQNTSFAIISTSSSADSPSSPPERSGPRSLQGDRGHRRHTRHRCCTRCADLLREQTPCDSIQTQSSIRSSVTEDDGVSAQDSMAQRCICTSAMPTQRAVASMPLQTEGRERIALRGAYANAARDAETSDPVLHPAVRRTRHVGGHVGSCVAQVLEGSVWEGDSLKVCKHLKSAILINAWAARGR